MDWFRAVRERVTPVSGGVDLSARDLGVVVAVAVVLVLVPPAWRRVRLGVTLVHELGHAIVGVLMGRRFVGFVIRGDMSGHAVTSGRTRGAGRVISAWAGYPMPALAGAGIVWLAARGWSAPAVSGALVVLVMVALRVRSVLTALVVAVSLAGAAALWWWRHDLLQEQVLTTLGLVLVAGGWRHLLAVVLHDSAADDPGALARLTHVPRAVWNLSFALACAAATWLVAGQLFGPGR